LAVKESPSPSISLPVNHIAALLMNQGLESKMMMSQKWSNGAFLLYFDQF
jgi:hypothetical protein